MQTPPPISERSLIAIVFAIQFVNIVDFMMVMPLGADFARSLGIDAAHIGIIGGSYTIGAAVSAIISAFFLDRYDRRTAVFYAMAGLIVATAACTLATNLVELVTIRVITGIFAGPLTSLVIAMIIDVVPAERRGQAMGMVISAFSIAAVLGVPIGLELAHLGGWQIPFFVISILSLCVAIATLWILPPMRNHLIGIQANAKTNLFRFFTHTNALLAYSLTGLSMLGGFLIIPNISAYVQFNLHYPREELSLLYLAGGTVSFIAMQLAGRCADRFGSFIVAFWASILLTLVMIVGFTLENILLPVIVIFAGFMLAMSLRSVAIATVIARVPNSTERAGFMAVNAAVQHLASAMGGMLSAMMLQSQATTGALIGMWQVSLLSILTTLCLPVLFWILENRLDNQSESSPRDELLLNEG
ncbi:arabinose efflux permease family protein [Beggiatoa alba B18LD]|uniref:Arabinose efflux permease family protein n=1 Tax=Beggiatoa alba B18LD TaxID=395493 RepID=I3CGR1_9GAMM|nr:MFS transporter [Beggiatoa alba]EIJ42804.1 arabinose efflux permease family protein [Beggiatoa alba B18LD]